MKKGTYKRCCIGEKDIDALLSQKLVNSKVTQPEIGQNLLDYAVNNF